jgi:hypothetical protein
LPYGATVNENSVAISSARAAATDSGLNRRIEVTTSAICFRIDSGTFAASAGVI